MDNNVSEFKKQRPIRSFVRREGRITPSQQRALDNLWFKYGVDLSSMPNEFSQLFQRSAPVIVEIGFGMGQSLLQQAQLQPENNYIGIEVHRPGVGSLLIQLEKLGMTNIKIYCADAIEVMCTVIPDHSLTKIQIFFPDPWPKKRHQKRRLIQPELVKLFIQKLRYHGIIHIATDWQDYAEHILRTLSNISELINLADDGNFVPRPADRPLTKFERRGKKLGHGVWDIIFKTKCHSSA